MFFLTRRALALITGLVFLAPVLMVLGWQKIVAVIGPPQTSGSPIVLGVAIELSGQVGPWGQAALKGIQMAVDEVNERGGIGKRSVQTVIADANDVTGLPGFAEQAQNSGALAVIGPVTPSKAEILSKSGLPIPLISLSTHPSIPTLGDNVFQGSYDDRQQGFAAALFASKRWGHRAVILVEEKSTYAQSLAQAFREGYESKGGKILKTLTYKRGQQDFGWTLSQAIQSNPELIYLPGYAKEARALLRQARDKGVHIPVIGGDGLESLAKELTAKEKEQLEWGLYYTTPNFLPTREADEFVSSFQRRYGEDPHPMALWAYDATRGLMAALSSPDAQKDPPGLAKQLGTHRGWPVAGGQMKIDTGRHAQRPMAVMQVGTELRLVEIVQP